MVLTEAHLERRLHVRRQMDKLASHRQQARPHDLSTTLRGSPVVEVLRRCSPLAQQPPRDRMAIESATQLAANFPQALSRKDASAQPHPQLYALGSKELHHLGLVIADLQTGQPSNEQLFQQIDNAQRLLKRTLVRTLSLVDARKGKLHVLDAKFGRMQRSPREQHSLRVLAAAIQHAAPGSEVAEVIAEYGDLLNTLDLAHSYLFYPERCALNHSQRRSAPATRMLQLIKGIEGGDPGQIGLAVELLPSALACCHQLVKVSEGMDRETVDLSADAELERLLGKVKDASTTEDGKEVPGTQIATLTSARGVVSRVVCKKP